MLVSRFKVLQKIVIFQPRWHDRTVLIACYKVGNENEIVFTKAPTLPDRYYIKGETIRKYPKVSNGKIDCYAVSLNELELLERGIA